MVSVKWWWVRHAPVPCPIGRIHGNLDVACDTSDEADFAALVHMLPKNPILVESGLLRCRQTTGGLEKAGMSLPPPIIETAFQEQDFGRWQGRSWTDLETAKDPDLKAFWQEPAYAVPPGGESFATQISRVAEAIDRLSRLHDGRDILAVVHAGTIRAALAHALEIKPDKALSLSIAPLSLTRIDMVHQGWRVELVNRLPA
jgi:alpha-ribazole phosphatase